MGWVAACGLERRRSYVGVVVDVHAGGAGKLVGHVLQDGVLVGDLDALLLEGFAH